MCRCCISVIVQSTTLKWSHGAFQYVQLEEQEGKQRASQKGTCGGVSLCSLSATTPSLCLQVCPPFRAAHQPKGGSCVNTVTLDCSSMTYLTCCRIKETLISRYIEFNTDFAGSLDRWRALCDGGIDSLFWSHEIIA